MALTHFPYRPEQAGYSAAYTSGVISVSLDGGMPRSRLDIVGAPRSVSVTWVLPAHKFDLFMGAVRNVERSGGASVTMNLILDSSEMDRYEVVFASPPQLVSKAGFVFTVSGSLLVKSLAKYLDEDTDIDALRAILIAFYGNEVAVSEMLRMLKALVTEDLPHA